MGYSATAKVFGTAGIPFMPFNTYKRIEAKLSPEIWKYWEKSREKAHVLEKAAAIERGDVDADGYCYMGVTADGGWYTRTIGKAGAYCSKSGNTVIRGLFTSKVLHIAVKLKTCSHCRWWKTRRPDQPISEHVCYQNHDGTPQSMEKIGLLEGFQSGKKRFQVSLRNGLL